MKAASRIAIKSRGMTTLTVMMSVVVDEDADEEEASEGGGMLPIELCAFQQK